MRADTLLANSPAPSSTRHNDLLDSAISLAGDLIVAAVHDNYNESHWMSWTVADSSRKRSGKIEWVQRASPYLYDGNAGVCLFLAYLFAATATPTYRELCRTGLRWALRQHRSHPLAWGFFSGGAGLAYSCIFAGRAILDGEIEEAGWKLLRDFEFHSEAGPDVISGVAGTLLALAACSACGVDNDVIEAKLRDGIQALKGMVDHSHLGYAWRLSLFPAPLTGYAHGAAGIAHSLLETLPILGVDDWSIHAAEESFFYEDHYSRLADGKLDWPDLRNNPALLPRIPGQQLFMRVWCYGSTGMAFSRLRAYEILGHEQYLRDALAAWNASASSVSAALDLCHGAGGMIDLDSEFYRSTGDSKYLDHAVAVARQCVAVRHQSGTWFNGTNIPSTDPSLMQGMAGMGMALLNAATGGHFPSILFPHGFATARISESRNSASVSKLRWDHIQAHFPRTTSLLDAPSLSHLKPILEDTGCSSTSDLMWFSEQLRGRAASDPPSTFTTFLQSSLEFESAVLQSKIELPQARDLFTVRFAPPWNEIDIDHAIFCRSRGVHIAQFAWNWKDLARDGSLNQLSTAPRECPTAFAFFPHEETAEFLRVTPLVSLLWANLVSPASGQALMQHCVAQVPADEGRLRQLLTTQLEHMYNAQMVTLLAQGEAAAA